MQNDGEKKLNIKSTKIYFTGFESLLLIHSKDTYLTMSEKNILEYLLHPHQMAQAWFHVGAEVGNHVSSEFWL